MPSYANSPGDARGHPQAGPRHVLMVLYHFPPVGGVSVARNVRNVQYLPDCGWNPVVIAPSAGASGISDSSVVHLIPEAARVIRATSPEAGHVRRVAIRVRRLLRSRRLIAEGRPRHGSNEPPEGRTVIDSGGDPPLGLAWLRRLFFFPDDQVGWLPFALVAAVRATRSVPIDAMYSTSSPVTAHLIAGVVRRLTGTPWVAEFRDPWIGNPLAPRLPWLHRRLQTRLERWIVRGADRIVCVTPSMTRMYQRRYPGATVETITNGYDRNEVVARGPRRRTNGRYRIVYTGTLDRPPELQVLVEGLEVLTVRHPDLAAKLEIVFYGAVSPDCRSIIETRTDPTVAGMLRFQGFVPRASAIGALADADAALVLLGSGPGMEVFVGGKLYEYLGQSRQILAVLPPGDARDVLTGLDWGVVAEPDASSIADAVERLMALPAPERIADPAGTYDRANLAARLAESLTLASASNAHREALRR